MGNEVTPNYGKCEYAVSADGKRTATLTFSVSEVLYDIDNMAWVEGDLMDDAELNHVRHIVQDIAQDGNRDRVMRVMSLAHEEADDLLYPWTREDVPESKSLDDTLEDNSKFVTNLNVPSSTSVVTINLLLKLIHEYMVCRVLEDWLSVTFPKSAPVWADKIEALKNQIRDAKRRSTWVTRRPMFPSW